MTKDDLFHRWYVNLNVTIPPVLEESKAFDKISFFKHLHNNIVYRDDEEEDDYRDYADGFDNNDEEDNCHDHADGIDYDDEEDNCHDYADGFDYELK